MKKRENIVLLILSVMAFFAILSVLKEVEAAEQAESNKVDYAIVSQSDTIDWSLLNIA